MLYVSGLYALNLSCSLDTCGDWHHGALNWKNVLFLESADLPWGNKGIEHNRLIPRHNECYNVANHIRALLDLIFLGDFASAQGMRHDFIDNEKYTLEIFKAIEVLKNHENWEIISQFMLKEYKLDWYYYLHPVNNGEKYGHFRHYIFNAERK